MKIKLTHKVSVVIQKRPNKFTAVSGTVQTAIHCIECGAKQQYLTTLSTHRHEMTPRNMVMVTLMCTKCGSVFTVRRIKEFDKYYGVRYEW